MVQLHIASLTREIISLLKNLFSKESITSMRKKHEGAVAFINKTEKTSNILDDVTKNWKKLQLKDDIQAEITRYRGEKMGDTHIDTTQQWKHQGEKKKIANYKKCRKNFIRKNILTTVAIITTKGWDLPNKVTSHKRQQQPESFIPRVIQCSWCLKAGHTRTSCQCIQSAVIAQRHTATMNAPCPSKIRTIASHLLIENVPTVLEHMGPQIPRLPIPSTM